VRSSASPVRVRWLACLALVVGGCETSSPPTTIDEPAPCEDSVLTYANFGEPFLLDWCRGCHSSGLPVDMRQNAPSNVNFDTLDQVHDLASRIEIRAVGDADLPPTMPPAAGPPDEERALLAEWLACGAP